MIGKKIIFGLIIFVLYVPLIQENLLVFSIPELKGWFVPANKSNFTFADWFKSDYQKSQDKYLNENFGFRKLLVRLNNEYRYRFFRTTSHGEAVFGKNDMFFALQYVNAYTGKDFIGTSEIISKSKNVKELQELMKKTGILFIPIFVPNKSRIYKENIPDRFLPANFSNYDGFVRCFDKLNISYINFNAYFESVKETSPYPFYSKYGVHWSYYASTFASDSIIKYINVHSPYKVPLMNWKSNIVVSDTLQHDDYDLGEGLNLVTKQLPSAKMGYPQITLYDTAAVKPSLLIIGDSYTHGIEQTGIPYKLFNDYKFFSYFKEKRPVEQDPLSFYRLDMVQEIKNHNIILLVCAEFNLQHFGWGFIERALNILKGGSDEQNIELNKIVILESDIRKNPDWMKSIEKTAIAENKSIDQVVHEQATYLIQKERTPVQGLSEWEKTIRQNAEWMKQIEKKASERKLSVDSMVVLDAMYMVSQQK